MVHLDIIVIKMKTVNIPRALHLVPKQFMDFAKCQRIKKTPKRTLETISVQVQMDMKVFSVISSIYI